MTYLRLSRWSGQLANKGVVAKIRRTIKGRIATGSTVVVFMDGVKELSPEIMADIQRNWPADKVRFAEPHPELGGTTAPEHRPGRRKL